MAINNLYNKSFLTRLLSGIVLILIILSTVITGKEVFFATTLFISLVGMTEIYSVLKINKKPLAFIGYLATIVYYFMIYYKKEEHMMMFIIAFLIVMLIMYVFTFPKYKSQEIMLSFFGLFYVAILLSYLYLIRESADGIFTIWLIFIASWGCDTCAYLFGMTLGKHKMAPVLSPKKSIEGAIGGVIGAVLIGLIYAFIVKDYISFIKNPLIVFPIVCFVGALISMVGDLAASAIKRNFEIKDYGKLIPGHGGVLDRFDSVIFIAPVIYYFLEFISKMN